MDGSELHAQAALWTRNGSDVAALFMEGEARDPDSGGVIAADALYRVALARGLRMTTDLDQLVRWPVRGWSLWLDAATVTLCWPHPGCLLDEAPLDVPKGWRLLAGSSGIAVLFVGYGFGLHEHRGGGDARPELRLDRLAERGAVAAGAVAVFDGAVRPVPSQRLGRPAAARSAAARAASGSNLLRGSSRT